MRAAPQSTGTSLEYVNLRAPAALKNFPDLHDISPTLFLMSYVLRGVSQFKDRGLGRR